MLGARQWTEIIVFGMTREVRFPLRVSHTCNTEAQCKLMLPWQWDAVFFFCHSGQAQECFQASAANIRKYQFSAL
jgi:hypothetical protein